VTDRIHLPSSLRRAGDLELERHRRSGRSFSLILLRLRPPGRAPGSRAVRRRRLRDRCAQHLRPFDAVDATPAADVVGIVTHDTDVAATALVVDRVAAELRCAGDEVLAVGSATFPSDGLLWSHLELRAAERLSGHGAPARTTGSIGAPSAVGGDR
jgi:hypothetical protein